MTFLLAENMFIHYYSLLLRQYTVCCTVLTLKDEAQTALYKDPVRTAL